MTGSQEHLVGGALLTAISNAVVQIVREYTGRGPTQARASLRDDVVVVLLQETLLKAEHSLISFSRPCARNSPRPSSESRAAP